MAKSEKLKKLKIRKRNYDNILNGLESVDEQNKNLNLNLRYENNSFLPPINNLKTMNSINNNENTKKEEIFNKGIKTERRKRKEEIRDNFLAVTGGIVKSLSLKGKNMIKQDNSNNVPKNDEVKKSLNLNSDLTEFIYNDNKNKDYQIRESLEDIFLKCINGVKTLESYEKKDKPKLKLHNYKKKYERKLVKDYITKDKQMKKYLFENISEFYKKNKQADFIKLKAKKDTIMKLSENFAYGNRKPLITLFYSDKKEEKKDEKKRHSPFSQLKLKDVKKKLETDISFIY